MGPQDFVFIKDEVPAALTTVEASWRLSLELLAMGGASHTPLSNEENDGGRGRGRGRGPQRGSPVGWRQAE